MIGINVPGDGSVKVDDLIRIGAKIARCDTYPAVDLTRWIDDCRENSITVCLVLGSTALTHDPANWGTRMYRIRQRYGGRGVIYACGNEPDAGWETGQPSDWRIEERRSEHPSSWILDHGHYQHLLDCALSALHGERRIGAGLCSGHPTWADGIRWASVESLSVHAYAKEAGTPELDALLNGYLKYRPGQKLWITETHARTRGLAAFLNDDPRVAAVIPFCYSDRMVPGFGLLEDSGALADYLAATNPLPGAIEPPQPVPIPEPVPSALPPYRYHVGPGLERVLRARGWEPLSGEAYFSANASATLIDTDGGPRIAYYWKDQDRVYLGPILEAA